MDKNVKEKRDYCLSCPAKPCSKKGCPLENDIPAFIHEEDTKKAFDILSKTTVLPAICGRVCPHSSQCQGSCVRSLKGEAVSIGQIESYIGDISLKYDYKISYNNQINYSTKSILEQKKVAIIGAGPAGLTCAAFLAMSGVKVDIYEKYNKLGGLLIHGIPDFRLEREIIEKSIKKIIDLGIKVHTLKSLGEDYQLNDLNEQYDAVFLAIGANEPNNTLVGENVLSGNKLLENINLLKEGNKDIKIPEFKGKKIAIYGGGNVAMDSARTLKRMGADVVVIYRRDEEQMPAEKYEIECAKNECVEFWFKTNILNVEGNMLRCIKTELVNRENSDRLVPVNVAGSEFKVEFDYIILATGSKTDENLLKSQGLETDKYGYTNVDEKYRTSKKNVYAGGDVAGSKATVAWAARSGREAAKSIIDDFIK